MSSETTSRSGPAERSHWDAALYDAKHSFVWKYGLEVIQLLSPKKGERILDLGCGTGHLSNQISLSGAEVIGLDRSPDMIEQARATYPHLSFVLADASDFCFPEPFDAVFSNAALHWMKRSAEVTDRISRALRPRGRFVAEFGGKGNLDAIHGSIHQAMQALGCPAGEDLNLLYFPTVGEYAPLLEARRLAVTYASLFDRPTPLEGGDDGLRHWIEMFARDFLARLAPPQQQQLMTMVENQLRPTLFRDGTWFADYRRIRVIAVRE